MENLENLNSQNSNQTPLNIVALVSRVVTAAVDRITGDRSDYPLLVCMSAQYALKKFNLQSHILYGNAAWLEIFEDQSIGWSGCVGEHITFWLMTEYKETVDLNIGVSNRKRSHNIEQKTKHSPPIIWSQRIPSFCHYKPTGLAEVELTDEKDLRWLALAKKEIDEKCSSQKLNEKEDFPPEAILCPNLRVLDDAKKSFQHFDRYLGIHGIPKRPF